jgi:1-pyrroline-5-carboxylate dehydrogenase
MTNFKITYSTFSNDESLHQAFDKAIKDHLHQFGRAFPARVGYERIVEAHSYLTSINPSDTRQSLHRFEVMPLDKIADVVSLAKGAQKSWSSLPWQSRVACLRKAATIIRDRKMEIAAAVCLEVGKNRLESLGDVEESADLFDYYATQVEENCGYVKPLMSLLPNETTASHMRPYGVFAVIAPFNFPFALAAGMSGAALLAGNSVVLKPSEETPWTGELLFEVLRDAGLPEGVLQICHGKGDTVGATLTSHPDIAGVAFTGSAAVGRLLFHKMSSGPFVKPCLMELGGKNGCIVTATADLKAAAAACAKSAFGLSGQKCSALSRIIVHNDVADEFIDLLIQETKAWKVLPARSRDASLGPVINKSSVTRYHDALTLARETAEVLFVKQPEDSASTLYGHFVGPVIVKCPSDHNLMKEELFLPFVCVTAYGAFDEAMAILNSVDYGLTAGIFSGDENEHKMFVDDAEAGVLYVNRKAGATTGAWPGVQAFCGWKASGASGKGGCGPYYVSQFMREQSRSLYK